MLSRKQQAVLAQQQIDRHLHYHFQFVVLPLVFERPRELNFKIKISMPESFKSLTSRAYICRIHSVHYINVMSHLYGIQPRNSYSIFTRIHRYLLKRYEYSENKTLINKQMREFENIIPYFLIKIHFRSIFICQLYINYVSNDQPVL